MVTLIGKAAASAAVSAAAGHGVKKHLKRKDHLFTKECWPGPKEYKRGGYIYSSNGKSRRRQGGKGGLLSSLGAAVKLGLKLGRDKRYKRMGAIGSRGHYKSNPRPWAV